jgi:hypothetical protein
VIIPGRLKEYFFPWTGLRPLRDFVFQRSKFDAGQICRAFKRFALFQGVVFLQEGKYVALSVALETLEGLLFLLDRKAIVPFAEWAFLKVVLAHFQARCLCDHGLDIKDVFDFGEIIGFGYLHVNRSSYVN